MGPRAKRLASVASAVLVLSGATAAGSASARPTAGARAVVAFDRVPAGLTERLRAAGVTHAGIFPNVQAAVIAGPAHARRAVAAWPEVRAVYPDRLLAFQTYQAVKNTHVDVVRAGAAPLSRPYTGKGVTVAVVDSGIDTTHPDLEGAVVLNLAFDLDRILRPVGDTPLDPLETAVGVDEFEHGTNLAGVIGGRGVAAVGDDMRGVAPDVTFVNLRIGYVNVAGTFESSALAAYDWLLAHRTDPRFPGGIRVTVNGWGVSVPMPATRSALQLAIDAGVIVLFPAGNEGAGADTVLYPAKYPELIAVGAACKDQDDWSKELWNPAEPTAIPRNRPLCEPSRVVVYSSRGPALDVVAPGHDIWTARPVTGRVPGWFPRYAAPPPPGQGDPVAIVSNGFWYTWWDSTSMAHAHVAGIAALMLEADPTLTQARVDAALKATARDLGSSGFDTDSGYGMVDALAAVTAIESAP